MKASRFVLCSVVIILGWGAAGCDDNATSLASGYTHCEGSTLYTWNDTSESYDITPCQSGCTNDACDRETTQKAECTNEKPVCINGALKQCAGGQYISEPCPNGCENGACKPDTPECTGESCNQEEPKKAECTNEAPVCVDGSLKVCEKGQYITKICPDGCENGTCKSQSEPQPACTDDDTPVCVDQTTLQSCQDGQLVTDTCEWKCENDACVEPICRDAKDDSCIDQKTRRFCQNFDYSTETCDYLCQLGDCIEPPCAVGDIKCGSNDDDKHTLYECQRDETTGLIDWHVQVNCQDNNLYCDPGLKSCEICVNNWYACNGNTQMLRHCELNDAGNHNEWHDALDCGAKNKVCDTDYRGCKLCKSGDVRCTDETLEICTGVQWLPFYDCAANGQTCNADVRTCVNVCENGQKQCFDNTLAHCVDDQWKVIQKCGSDTCNAELDACTCEPDTYACNNNVLTQCNGKGWDVIEDCGQFACKAELAKCDYECTESDAPTCTSVTTKQTCIDHRFFSESCLPGERCSDGACEPDPCAQCTDEQVCINDVCQTKLVDTPIGKPCTCSGSDCFITITGSEFNASLSFFASLVYSMKKTASVTTPNFFATGISGCEALTAPTGMKIGCLLDSKIEASTDLTDWLDSIANTLNSMGKAPLGTVISNIATILKKTVKFSAPKGYCFTAAMDANLKMNADSGLVSAGLNTDKFEPLVDKFDAGKYTNAKIATCPAGSTLIPDVNKTGSLAGYGDLSLDMAMCLKQCITDADCRTEDGYSCINWHNQKVCFIQSTIDNIHELEDSFGLKNK